MSASVLVPLDGSPLAEEALAAVEPLTRSADLELQLLRVVPPARAVVAEGRVIMAADELTALHRREAVEYLETQAAALRRRGFRLEARVAVGDPAATILAEAVASGATVIVMATHGRAGLPRVLFGSVTAAVVRASPIPVLTVHGTAKPLNEASTCSRQG